MKYYQNGHLDGSSFFWNGSPVGLLLIHGFTATTIEVKAFARILHKANISVFSPLLPGHGTSPDDMNSKSWNDWASCIEKAYKDLSKSCKYVYVGGESMGAVLALLLAERHPEIKGVMLYAPAIKVAKLRFARFLRFFIPWIPKSSSADDIPWQGYTVYPLKAANELRKLQKIVTKNFSSISQPTAVFLGAYDKTIDPDSGDFIYNNIRSIFKEKHIYKKSGHVMLLGSEIEEIAYQTLMFISKTNTFES